MTVYARLIGVCLQGIWRQSASLRGVKRRSNPESWLPSGQLDLRIASPGSPRRFAPRDDESEGSSAYAPFLAPRREQAYLLGRSSPCSSRPKSPPIPPP